MRFTVTESVASGPPPLVLQTMVKVDWEVMVAVYGEFREKLLLLSAFPLASLVPEGSVTSQEVTLLPLQEMVEVVPERTRPGLAVIVACGWVTVTVAMFESAEPPGPEQDIW